MMKCHSDLEDPTKNLRFTSGGKNYMIISTEKRNGDFFHIVRNLDTGVIKELPDKIVSKFIR